MNFNLGAPTHTASPVALAAQLPALQAVISKTWCRSASVTQLAAQQPVALVQVYAAQLGLTRDRLTLESLPALNLERYLAAQTLCQAMAKEFANDGLSLELQTYPCASLASIRIASNLASTSNSNSSQLHSATLSNPAMLIGQDLRQALPASSAPAAQLVRQWVNHSQMLLQAQPDVAQGVFNSLWCAGDLPQDSLSKTWVTEGVAGWWQALPAWDVAHAALLKNAIDENTIDAKAVDGKAIDKFSNTSLDVMIGFADVQITLQLQRRSAWKPWQKAANLAELLALSQTAAKA